MTAPREIHLIIIITVGLWLTPQDVYHPIKKFSRLSSNCDPVVPSEQRHAGKCSEKVAVQGKKCGPGWPHKLQAVASDVLFN